MFFVSGGIMQMTKKSILAITALSLLILNTQYSFAQSRTRKVEVGAQFTFLRVSNDQEGEFALPSDIEDTLIGGGVRLGYNITNDFTVEAEGNLFRRPSDMEGRRSQGVFGIKWGRAGEKAGVFGKIRPGFMRFDRILSFVRSPVTNLENKTNVYFALDVGAVIEAYPSSRSIIRFDVGDTIVRFTNRRIEGFEPGAIPILKTNYGHNFQFSAGVGFRF